MVEALDEFAIALGVLVLGLVAFAVQVSDWKPTDERYVVVKKLIYGLAASGVLAFLAVVFIKRKDQKPWSNIDALNALLASTGNAIAFAYYNTPWRFVFTAAISCVLTWFVARAWFLTATMSGTVVNKSASPGQGVVVADSLRGCEDEWLHDKLKTDKIKIKELVRFPGIMYNPDFQKAHIDFVFSVFNNSLYDIVIENSVTGEIRYGEDNDAFYYQPKFLSEKLVECPSRSGTYFTIRQAIRQEEIPRFRDADDVLIWFHGLQINFQGTEQFPEVEATTLNTQHYLQTKKRIWRDWDQLQFVFGYTEEQWNTIRSGSVENAAEVERLRTELNLLKAELEPKALSEALQKPRLTFLRIDDVLVYYNELYNKIVKYENKPRTADWRLKHPSFRILVAYYRNPPDEARQPNLIRNVTAELTYNGTDDPYVVSRGFWFPENASAIDIPYNDARGVIIAEHHRSEIIYGRDKNDRVELNVKEQDVIVRLFVGTDGSTIEGGTFKIKSVQNENGFDFQATKVN